jgi:hypothetical protein
MNSKIYFVVILLFFVFLNYFDKNFFTFSGLYLTPYKTNIAPF